MLNTGKVTSREILTVLALRCTVVGGFYNYVTEVDFDVADLIAAKCDEERARSGRKNWTFQD